jgi:ParB family transcriptional regulator, chromosome partitioning protein
MATQTTPMTAKLADLVVDEEQNPRGPVSAADVAELAKSVKQHGVLQPVLVEETDEGLALVAGYRRVKAAREAGLTEIPVHVREAGESRLTFALSENLPGLRKDMDPVAEAKAIAAISNGGKVNRRALAKRLGKSEEFVRGRLELLALPERAQELVAAGKVPVGASAILADVAKSAPEFAAQAAELVAKDERLARELTSDPASVFSATVEESYAKLEAAPKPGEVVAVDVSYTVDVGEELPVDPEQREGMIERLAEIRGDHGWNRSSVSFSDEDYDALRALGVLVEFEPSHEWGSQQRFCVDDEALADQVAQAIEREAAEAAERLEAEAAEREQARAELAKREGKEPSEVDPEEIERQRRRDEREERERRKEEARTANLELGHRLLKRRGRKVSQKRQLARAKAIAHLAISSSENLVGAGLRLTREAWQEVEVQTFKNGRTRERATHLEPWEARDRLLEEIDRASSVETVMELVTEALVAATYASEDELAQSARCHGHVRGDAVVDETIDAEAKGVLPDSLKAVAKRRAELRKVSVS